MLAATDNIRGDKMDNAAALQRLYERLNAGDADGAVEVLADDFVEHEADPGLDPTKEGTKQLFRMMIAAFPICASTPKTS